MSVISFLLVGEFTGVLARELPAYPVKLESSGDTGVTVSSFKYSCFFIRVFIFEFGEQKYLVAKTSMPSTKAFAGGHADEVHCEA